MTLEEAKSLKKGDKVIDSDGSIHVFIDLDEDNNLHVICRAVYGGIHLYRDGCSIYKRSS